MKRNWFFAALCMVLLYAELAYMWDTQLEPMLNSVVHVVSTAP